MGENVFLLIDFKYQHIVDPEDADPTPKRCYFIGGDFVRTHQVVAKACYQTVREGAPLILVGHAGINLQRWASHHEEIPAWAQRGLSYR